MDIAARAVEHILYLGEKLFAAAIAQARGHKGQRLLVEPPLHLVHKPAWVALEEVLGLISRRIFGKKLVYTLLLVHNFIA